MPRDPNEMISRKASHHVQFDASRRELLTGTITGGLLLLGSSAALGQPPDGEIKPFLQGAFFLATKAQVDIVPMALVGTYELLPMNTYHIKCRPLEMRVGKPISTTGLKMRDLPALSAQVQKAIEDLYYRA